MQLTIEISDELAARWASQQERLGRIVERALRQEWSLDLALCDEMIAFLARGPQPQEIMAFRPSDQSLERVRELLERHRAGVLTAKEEAELDEISALNRLFTRLKAEARHLVQPA
jgi:hypothetical protein